MRGLGDKAPPKSGVKGGGGGGGGLGGRSPSNAKNNLKNCRRKHFFGELFMKGEFFRCGHRAALEMSGVGIIRR